MVCVSNEIRDEGAVENFTGPVSRVVLFTLDRCRSHVAAYSRPHDDDNNNTNNTNNGNKNVTRGGRANFPKKKKINTKPNLYNIIYI